MNEHGKQDILIDLIKQPDDLMQIAQDHRLSFEEFTRAAASPDLQEQLRNVTTILEACAKVAIGQARIRAIPRLESEDLSETQRKACVDLIKHAPAPLIPVAPLDAAAPSTALIDAATQDMLREALGAYANTMPDNADAQ